jgi:ribosomal protein L29
VQKNRKELQCKLTTLRKELAELRAKSKERFLGTKVKRK